MRAFLERVPGLCAAARQAARRRGLLLALLLPALPAAAQTPAPVPEAPPGFTPHRASYDLTLSRTRAQSKVTQAGGQLEFEWADACDAWTVSQRSRIHVTYNTGRNIDFGWSHNSWESKDGTRYRYFIRRIYAGGEVEETRGAATLEAPGKQGAAVFTLPEEKEVPLPAGTIFPTGHSLEMMAAAEAGSLPIWRTVFDGSGDDGGLYGVSATLSHALADGVGASLDSELLKDRVSWRLQLAFFGLGAGDVEPEQEQALRLFANGIADDLTFDYGDFALDAKLVELEALPDPAC